MENHTTSAASDPVIWLKNLALGKAQAVDKNQVMHLAIFGS